MNEKRITEVLILLNKMGSLLSKKQISKSWLSKHSKYGCEDGTRLNLACAYQNNVAGPHGVRTPKSNIDNFTAVGTLNLIQPYTQLYSADYGVHAV